ncbi:MAG TPA: DUF6518 family protein [Nocardioides sp.]|nr:DUF6518 family protein [Nocardioides sp.]
MRWILVIGLGLALGSAAAASDAAAGALDQTPLDRATSMLLNAGCVWAGAAVLAGWLVRGVRPSRGALAGTAALVVGVLTYYGYGVLLGDRTANGAAAVSAHVRLWAIAAVAAGPPLGAIGTWCRAAGARAFLARSVVPVGAITEMLVVRGLDVRTFEVDPALAWVQSAIVLVAALSILAAMLCLWHSLVAERST